MAVPETLAEAVSLPVSSLAPEEVALEVCEADVDELASIVEELDSEAVASEDPLMDAVTTR